MCGAGTLFLSMSFGRRVASASCRASVLETCVVYLPANGSHGPGQKRLPAQAITASKGKLSYLCSYGVQLELDGVVTRNRGII